MSSKREVVVEKKFHESANNPQCVREVDETRHLEKQRRDKSQQVCLLSSFWMLVVEFLFIL